MSMQCHLHFIFIPNSSINTIIEITVSELDRKIGQKLFSAFWNMKIHNPNLQFIENLMNYCRFANNTLALLIRVFFLTKIFYCNSLSVEKYKRFVTVIPIFFIV